MHNDNTGIIVLIAIGLIGIAYTAILYSKAGIPIWQVLLGIIPFIGPFIMWARLLGEWPIEKELIELRIHKGKTFGGDDNSIEAAYQYAQQLASRGKTEESQAIVNAIEHMYAQSPVVSAKREERKSLQ